jgi:hypothetical protein
MAVTFPSLKPTNRTVSQGTYAVKMFKFITGLTAARRYGTSPHSATLDLEYSNITNALWDDIEEPLRSQLKGTFIWRFAQAPTVNQSAVPGYKSVSIQLEGQRDG